MTSPNRYARTAGAAYLVIIVVSMIYAGLIGLGIVSLVTQVGADEALAPAQVHGLVERLVEVRAAALDVVLVFVGFGATLFCALLLRSRLVPPVLAGWGVFTYVSMLGLAVLSLLVPDHPAMIETVLYGLGTGFELVFGGWLLIKGVRHPPTGVSG